MLQDIAKNGPNPKARTCAVKALQRLAEIEDARQHIIETGGQPFLEAQAGGSEADSFATALKDNSDPEGQSSACQAVIDAIREDHASAMCDPWAPCRCLEPSPVHLFAMCAYLDGHMQCSSS